MSVKDISDEVRRFIESHIDTYGQLQVLLLLAKEPGRQWDSSAVGQELRTNTDISEKLLFELCERGILISKAGPPKVYYFDPPAELERIVAELTSAHSIYHSRIIAMIYDRPAKSLRDFANAFKFKKGDDNG